MFFSIISLKTVIFTHENQIFYITLALVSLLVLSACKNPFRYTDAREIPVSGEERVKKNIEEGRGV